MRPLVSSWEQRKLGDLISVYIAHAGPEEDVTVLTSSRDGIQKQEDHFGRLQQHDTSDWNLIPYGYCTYRNRSDDGLFTFNVNKVADRGIVSKFYPVFETPECDADFLVAYLNSSQEIRKKLFVLAVGTSQVVLSYGALKELSLLLPQNREQSAIANVLNHIDNLITLHQRKRKYRGLYGYLSWEQRKLGELFVESDERSSTEEILSVSVANGIYPASESERDTNPGASIANYKIVRVGDIVYNSMRMWQGAVGSSRYNGIVSPAYVVAKPVVELDSTCFGYLLKRPELLYKYLCNSQGNSKDTQTLRYERFAEITAEVPSTIEEQRAISDCLEGLDSLITLHQ